MWRNQNLGIGNAHEPRRTFGTVFRVKQIASAFAALGAVVPNTIQSHKTPGVFPTAQNIPVDRSTPDCCEMGLSHSIECSRIPGTSIGYAARRSRVTMIIEPLIISFAGCYSRTRESTFQTPKSHLGNHLQKGREPVIPRQNTSCN